MGYETSPFGGVGNVETKDAQGTAGTTNTHFGTRDTQDAAAVSGGKVRAVGSVQEGVIYFTGDEISGTEITTGLTIPAGSRVIDATLEFVEDVTMGNADNDIIVGTFGSSVTNGLDFDNTNGTGTHTTTAINGTWGSVLAADTVVGIDMAGTAVAAVAGGKGKVVIRYKKV